MKLPDETEKDVVLAQRIRDGLDEGKTVNVTVLSAMGIDKIFDVQEATN